MSEVKDKAYYENLDKRTKEYKEWAESQKEELLGDKIEKFTEATGIKAAVDKISEVTGKDCGCNARKEAINNFHRRIKEIFIHKQPDLLTEDEYIFLRDFFAVNRTRVTANEQASVYKIYNRVFEQNQQPTMCPSCWKRVKGKLMRLLEFQRKWAKLS